MSIFTKLLSGGADAVMNTVSGIVDKFVQTPDEKAKILQDAQIEINRHFEAVEANATKQLELEIQNTSNARQREVEITRSLGHVDYMMWFLGVSAILIFAFLVWHLVKENIPDANRDLVFNILGVLEGTVMAMYSYYWGSSAGSRIKDMRSSQSSADKQSTIKGVIEDKK